MSWMSPSYVLQTKFDLSWSPLASRYSLWLYREVGWEGNEVSPLPPSKVQIFELNASFTDLLSCLFPATLARHTKSAR